MNRKERRNNDPSILHKRIAFASQNSGGYGLPNSNAKPTSGQQPTVNPFIIPKQTGITHFSQTFPNQYMVEWDLSTWRAACDQATKCGYPVSYAVLVNWCYECSSFVQSLFQGVEIGISDIPITMMDSKGNIIDEWKKEISDKKWFRDLLKEVLFANFWGFTGLNFDPISEKVYKYPMQDIDPINRMIRQSTYNFWNGLYFSDYSNLLYVQPNSGELFLGYMQSITRSFIQMNLNNNNWIAAGKRIAFPLMTVGYPQDNNITEGGELSNASRAEAEAVIRTADPTNGLVYPYTRNPDGSINKVLELNFEGGKSGNGMWRLYSEFNAAQKDDILSRVFTSTLTSNVNDKGTYALGKIHMDKYQMSIRYLVDNAISELNGEFMRKLPAFYKKFPKDINLSINKAKEWTLEELQILAPIVQASGKKFTDTFFEQIGLTPDEIEDAPETKISESNLPPEPDTELASKSEKRTLLGTKKKSNVVRIGREYVHSHVHLSAKKEIPKKNLEDIEGLQDDEMQFAYDNPKKKSLFMPMFAAYNSLFFATLKNNLSIQNDFENLKDTSWWEQYILNSFQFTASKNRAEIKLLQAAVYDENHELRSFADFKAEAKNIVDLFNTTWLRTEYEMVNHGAIMAAQWRSMESTKDIYPNWIYKCADAPCEICKPFDEMVFEIGTDGDDMFPPLHYNCLCTVEPTDEGPPQTDEQVAESLENVPEEFQYNAGIDGVMPTSGSSYFDVLPSANDADPDMFHSYPERTLLNQKYYDRYAVMVTLKQWKDVNPNHKDIVFRNHEWLLNVRMTQDSVNRIGKKTRGFENIKNTIEHPAEIWMSWVNKNDQKKVLTHFIVHDGKNDYIVEVKNGEVQDAYFRKHEDSKQARKMGIKIIK